ncbi:MAG: GNAT family N-acetyltransferase [Thermomicrobiales bacterium]
MLPRDLGDGLVLRRATVADTERLADFNAEVHQDLEEPDVGIDVWTRDMMRGDHPTTGAGDFLIVEDTHSGAIVSSLCSIAQRWSYSGIPFTVGRLEMVGTHPDYRRRGLVRAQFEVVHHLGAERGELVQVIGGIPWYYRQFGYEMALELDTGRFGYPTDVPDIGADETDLYRIRPATAADIPFLARAYEYGMQRGRIACLRDADQWRYDIAGHSATSDMRLDICLIETGEGTPVGFFAHHPRLWNGGIYVAVYELSPGVSWLPVTPTVLRYLKLIGETYAAASGNPFNTINFGTESEHPIYHVIPSKLRGIHRPYAWYVRVADLAGFLRHIAPALDARLADSILVGHTGELKLNFYRTGLSLQFTEGHLTEVGVWHPSATERGPAAFPNLTFLQLLFGYKSLDELNQSFPDCMIRTDDARVLLDTLFPKQASNIWPIA